MGADSRRHISGHSGMCSMNKSYKQTHVVKFWDSYKIMCCPNWLILWEWP